jgi:hypothetical protein
VCVLYYVHIHTAQVSTGVFGFAATCAAVWKGAKARIRAGVTTAAMKTRLSVNDFINTFDSDWSSFVQLGFIRLKESDRIWKVTLRSHLKRCGARRLPHILHTEKEPRQPFASAAILSNEILHCKRDPSRCGNAFSMRKGLVRHSCHSRHSRHPANCARQ